MLMMPLARVRDASEWIDKVLDAREHLNEDNKRLRSLLRAVDKAYVEPIRQYQFPVTTLPSSTPLEAVCTIFETLNRTGVPLTIFELICARAFADGESLLRKWRETCALYSILVDFDIDPYYILQVIALRRGASCKRGAVLALPAAAISSEWDDATADFAAVLRMLRDDCGVLGAEVASVRSNAYSRDYSLAISQDRSGTRRCQSACQVPTMVLVQCVYRRV